MNLFKTLPTAFICVSSIATLAAEDSTRSTPSKQEQTQIDQATGPEVGLSAKDGITVSGNRAFVTRNGNTEALVGRLTLDDGTEVMPDGTIHTKGGATVTLKAEQILGFDGTIAAAPIKNPPPQPRKPSSLAAPSALGGAGKQFFVRRSNWRRSCVRHGNRRWRNRQPRGDRWRFWRRLHTGTIRGCRRNSHRWAKPSCCIGNYGSQHWSSCVLSGESVNRSACYINRRPAHQPNHFHHSH
jgi:hypothetical protein